MDLKAAYGRSNENEIVKLKGTVSRDWGELLMVETDKAHFFNVAGYGFYSILIAFSYRKV